MERNNIDWKTSVRRKVEEAFKTIIEKEIKKFSWENYKFNYRTEHNNLVYSIGIEMARKLGADLEVIEAAILLHDIGRAVTEKGHAKESARMAIEILEKTNFPVEKIDAVSYAISIHAGWNGSEPKTLEAKILWDADKLSKVGASVAILWTMTLPLKGKDSRDAISELNEWLETAEKITKNMKTELGAKIAKERFQNLKSFVNALNEELK